MLTPWQQAYADDILKKIRPKEAIAPPNQPFAVPPPGNETAGGQSLYPYIQKMTPIGPRKQ